MHQLRNSHFVGCVTRSPHKVRAGQLVPGSSFGWTAAQPPAGCPGSPPPSPPASNRGKDAGLPANTRHGSRCFGLTHFAKTPVLTLLTIRHQCSLMIYFPLLFICPPLLLKMVRTLRLRVFCSSEILWYLPDDGDLSNFTLF